MSEGQVPSVPVEEELPIKKYLESSRVLFAKVKDFDFKTFFQGLITFFSIVTAYFIVEVTHQHHLYFQKIAHIKLNQAKTLPLVLFLISIYLIFWNLVAKFLKNRALRPPPKTDQYEENPLPEPEGPPVLAPLPNGQIYYHEIIYDSFNKTIYFFLLLVAIAAHAYFNQDKRANLPRLMSIQRLNYIGIWFLIAVQLFLLGQLLQKMTKIRQFKTLGISIAFIISLLLLGLANGYNTFIFI